MEKIFQKIYNNFSNSLHQFLIHQQICLLRSWEITRYPYWKVLNLFVLELVWHSSTSLVKLFFLENNFMIDFLDEAELF